MPIFQGHILSRLLLTSLSLLLVSNSVMAGPKSGSTFADVTFLSCRSPEQDPKGRCIASTRDKLSEISYFDLNYPTQVITLEDARKYSSGQRSTRHLLDTQKAFRIELGNDGYAVISKLGYLSDDIDHSVASVKRKWTFGNENQSIIIWDLDGEYMFKVWSRR